MQSSAYPPSSSEPPYAAYHPRRSVRSPLTSSQPSPSLSASHSHSGRATPTQQWTRQQELALFGPVVVDVEGLGEGVVKGLPKAGGARERAEELLLKNHLENDAFTNDKLFHNHLSHHLLAALSLGGTPLLLTRISSLHTLSPSHTRPLPPLQPLLLTPQNWTQHLGQPSLYPNYLAFFSSELAAQPPVMGAYAARGDKTCLALGVEKYLMDERGEMLLRAMGGALHPLIGIGYGVEFGAEGIVAEGLAQAACQSSSSLSPLFPHPWPPQPAPLTGVQGALSNALSGLSFRGAKWGVSSAAGGGQKGLLSNLAGGGQKIAGKDDFELLEKAWQDLPRTGTSSRLPNRGVSALTLLQRMMDDPLLGPQEGERPQEERDGGLERTVRGRKGERIREWAELWVVGGSSSSGGDSEESSSSEGEATDEEEYDHPSQRRRQPTKQKSSKKEEVTPPTLKECADKVEELIWLTVVLAVGTSRPGYEQHKIDFFLIHCLTSSLFLPVLLAALPPSHRSSLLRSHFRVTISYWIARGRPRPYIKEVLMSATAFPRASSEGRKEGKESRRRTAWERAVEFARAEAEGGLAAATSGGGGGQAREEEGEEGIKTPTMSPSLGGSNGWSAFPPPSSSSAASSAAAGAANPTDHHEQEEEEEEGEGNPWLSILSAGLAHTDEHLLKSLRLLYFASTHFGSTSKGVWACSLPGSETLDGSVFLRAAGVLVGTLGWPEKEVDKLEGEGEKVDWPGTWDFSALGRDEAWEGVALSSDPRKRRWLPSDLKGKSKARQVPLVSKLDEGLGKEGESAERKAEAARRRREREDEETRGLKEDEWGEEEREREAMA